MCSTFKAIFLSLITGLLLTALPAAAKERFTIVNSTDAGAYRAAIDTLTQQLPAGSSREYLLDKTPPQALWHALSQAETLIAIGSNACEFAIKEQHRQPVLCGFITEKSFQTIIAEHPPEQAVTAIYIDQPLERLIDLAQLLRRHPSAYRIGLLSNNSPADQQLIDTLSASQPDVHLRTTELLVDDNPIEKIEPLISHTDVFIVRPSASFFNRLAAKLILQLSLRYQTPVIGFSQSYTKAGALISLYSSPEDIGLDIAEQLQRSPQDRSSPLLTARHGKHFSLSVNHHVARKFEVSVDAEQLSLQLITMDQKRRDARPEAGADNLRHRP